LKINEVIIDLKEYKFKLRSAKTRIRFAQMLNKHIEWSDSVMIMGVDHGEDGGHVPRIWSRER